MAQEDKELLLKDLCGRLSHDIKVDCSGHIYYLNEINVGNKVIDYISVLIQDEKRLHYPIQTLIDNIKPYLRPMSSMTDEEWKELNCIGYIVPLYDGCFGVDMRAYCKNGQPHYRRFSEFSTIEDWLNSHHFDYRGLIERGLALEAPEGMYK